MKRLSGFSLVEAIVMMAVFSIIFLGFQRFFSHGIRSTLKGQDTLQTIREASLFFSQLSKDFLASNRVFTGSAILSLDLSTQDLPPIGDSVYANSLTLMNRNATITYTFIDGDQYILRSQNQDPNPPKETKFALPRMKTFEILLVEKQNKADPAAAASSEFQQDQVFVRIVVVSNDPRYPSKEVQLTSFFVTNKMSTSNWNYFYN